MSKKGNNFERDLVDRVFHGFCRFGPGSPYVGPQTTLRKVYKKRGGLIYGLKALKYWLNIDCIEFGYSLPLVAGIEILVEY
jgi:hypothetical protein